MKLTDLLFPRATPLAERATPPELVWQAPLRPDNGWTRGYPQSTSLTVTEDSVLGIPAVWAAVRTITEPIATMPIDAYVGDEELLPKPSLLLRPNPLESRIDTYSKLVYSLVLCGEAFGLLYDFDEALYPQHMAVVHPSLVRIEQDSNGKIRRYIGNDEVSPLELLHIKGPIHTADGLRGMSVIDAHRRSFGHVLAQEDYGLRQWTESSVPPATLTVDTDTMDLDEQSAGLLQAKWVEARKRRFPAVLPNSITFQELSAFSPENAQYIEARQFSLQEVANLFGISAYRLGAPGSNTTYQNAQQDDLYFYKQTLVPYLARMELALLERVPATSVKFNADAFLRADAKTRADVNAINIGSGVTTVDEAREKENKQPLGAQVSKEQIEMLGSLIRSGFEPEASCEALGLPPITHTGLNPVTLAQPQEEAAPIEEEEPNE